ncbi:MAG: MFS transporter [Verrucomicrobiota bacterium]|nr:MFS transporter [Verrucomicrobiota bacterium]
MSVSVVLYKNLGVSNQTITFYTAWLYLPWVIKPLWSPAVDILKTRRRWIWTMQFLLGAMFAAVGLAIPAPDFFRWTLVFFWLAAFSSATHDVAADGFYMLALAERQQAAFSGIRNTFYRVANIAAQGGLVALVGTLYNDSRDYASAWREVFAPLAVVFGLLAVYHRWILPRPAADAPGKVTKEFAANFLKIFISFFQKPRIGWLLAFLLLFRFGEAQLVAMTRPFLLDARSAGGLGLSDSDFGAIYGTCGVAALLCGGILGGLMVARQGLKFWLWPMLLAIHLPDAVFIWLAWAQPANHFAIAAAVVVEQFGYGFGFTAFMLYMIYIARGEHRTAHYAICTGFMALGMMTPSFWSGWLQERIGYVLFFTWVILATAPGFLVALRAPLDPEFGKRALAGD